LRTRNIQNGDENTEKNTSKIIATYEIHQSEILELFLKRNGGWVVLGGWKLETGKIRLEMERVVVVMKPLGLK
jgi:hypothetical protein